MQSVGQSVATPPVREVVECRNDEVTKTQVIECDCSGALAEWNEIDK